MSAWRAEGTWATGSEDPSSYPRSAPQQLFNLGQVDPALEPPHPPVCEMGSPMRPLCQGLCETRRRWDKQTCFESSQLYYVPLCPVSSQAQALRSAGAPCLLNDWRGASEGLGASGVGVSRGLPRPCPACRGVPGTPMMADHAQRPGAPFPDGDGACAESLLHL